MKGDITTMNEKKVFYYFSLKDYSESRIRKTFTVQIDDEISHQMFRRAIQYTGSDLDFLDRNGYICTIKEGYIEGILTDYAKFSKMRNMMYSLSVNKKLYEERYTF
jgi:hypothetical protein